MAVLASVSTFISKVIEYLDGPLNDLWKFDGQYWTWISGSSSINQSGIYGTKGVANSSNVPGARYALASVIDSHNNIWIFGGDGYDSSGNSKYFYFKSN